MAVNRQEAWELLNEYVKSPNLIRHCLAVEAAVRGYARLYGEDEELWGLAGLLHDFDYEIHPTLDQHPSMGKPILEARGVPQEVIYAIQSHSDFTGVPRVHLLDKVLYASDEISGFIVAVALVKPSRSIHEVDVKSVKKKLKDKAFARNVNRDDIYRGAEELGVDLDTHIANVIEFLKPISDELTPKEQNVSR
nr:HDIG domain-containing metalloprotein [Thermobaculum terrenum]